MVGQRRQSRCWCRVGSGSFEVQARVERFVEPALLLLLQNGPSHGYQLAEELAEIVGETRVDLGNLYRLLRSIEEDGLVRSSWRPDLPGPLKRTYEITTEGESLLEAWVDSLRLTQARVATFINRYDESRRTA